MLGQAIDVVGLDSKTDLYLALRSIIVVRPSQQPAFDEAFDLFFGGVVTGVEIPEDFTEHRSDQREAKRAVTPVFARNVPDPDDEAADEEISEVRGASALERLSHRDFGTLDANEQEQVRRLIDRMVWKPAAVTSRRWGPPRKGVRPDLRRTLRNVSGATGDLMPLEWTDPRMRRRPLVVIADISGSMERYSELFLHFIHAAQGKLGRVESFVFATRLSRITREMRLRRPEQALAKVALAVSDWSGGTRIGEALETFNRVWARRVTHGGAICLIISDGWDTGDPELLSTEMARLARSVHRIVWLNPLAGRSGYKPATRGMQAALPYIDDLLAAGTLVDLHTVVRLLESIPARRGGRVAAHV